jgi:hypothetical protein
MALTHVLSIDEANAAADMNSRVQPITAMVVGQTTSKAFMLPAHQVNARHAGSGRYKNIDFVNAGKISTYKRFTKDLAPPHDSSSRYQFIKIDQKFFRLGQPV